MFSRVFHCLTARQIFAANLVSKALDGTNIGRPESLATIPLNLELACKIYLNLAIFEYSKLAK